MAYDFGLLGLTMGHDTCLFFGMVWEEEGAEAATAEMFNRSYPHAFLERCCKEPSVLQPKVSPAAGIPTPSRSSEYGSPTCRSMGS